MTPTVLPPPPVVNGPVTSELRNSLNITIHKLRDLIFGIALPEIKTRTKTAKPVAVTGEVLRLARDLAASACTMLQEHHNGLQLGDISRQLQDIKAHLCPANVAQPPQKPSYTAALSAGVVSPILIVNLPIPQPGNVRQYDMTLKQKSHNRLEFAKISNTEPMSKAVGALRDAGIWREIRSRTPDSEGNQGTE